MNVDASGTSTSANAGFGLFTVRAQSHAMTVRLASLVCLQVRPLPHHLWRNL